MGNLQNRRNWIYLLTDLISLSIAFILTIYITKKRLIVMPEIDYKTDPIEIVLLFLFIFIWIVFSNLSGLYDSFKITSNINEFISLIKSVLVQLLVVIILLFFLKSILFSRFFLLIYILSLTILLKTNRIVLKLLINTFKGKGILERKIVIIGDNKSGTEFYNMISSRKDLEYKILGMICDDKPKEDNIVYLGSEKKLEQILDENEIDDIIISLGISEYKDIESILCRCEKYPVRVRIIPEYSRFLSQNYNITTFGDIPIISLEDDPLDKLHWKFIKRALDISVSLFGFIFFFIWLYPIIGILIKVTSKGPVFFKQERWGIKNRKMIVYKFRTMKIDSQDVDENGKFNQAIKNDPRITLIGSILRKKNLDELPQILNVLIGNMSIVGPRPHATQQNIEFKSNVNRYLKRHLVKPGITGWAQVNGLRGETRKEGLMEKRVEHDIWYIENWSLWLDLQIILLTMWNMIKGESDVY